MKLLLENWRKYINEAEEQNLLLEQALLEEGWVADKWAGLKASAHDTLKKLATEWSQTKEVATTLDKIFKGEDISDNEKGELITQAGDVARVVGLGSVKMIPFVGLPLVVLIIYTMKKMGLRPLPTAWSETDETTI